MNNPLIRLRNGVFLAAPAFTLGLMIVLPPETKPGKCAIAVAFALLVFLVYFSWIQEEEE